MVGEALLAFKKAITTSEGIFLNWCEQDVDPCNWKGVRCDSHTKRRGKEDTCRSAGINYFTEDIAARSQAVARQFKSLKVKAVVALLSLSRNDTAEDVDSNNEKEKSYGYMMMERLTGSPDGRIDHVLQVYSCSNYWRDHDTALFILKHLYHDIPEETPTDDPERMPIRLFYVRDPIAERFP
ncbi:hypothetical protein OsI_25712 [Oryza sativa Indica Group]|uniref:Leucine-rich repeat-containing N-terminal plant-type domain-containing protein n=2 Tax=Oryza sativa TaxID=4530 RepID=B9FWR6_ORYSJ|nr:hypothetical protein OsI_25712 [Oryza sativa Indica Group]EEE67003.1 hypothetical protein OsJ_23919 [Oryza sativa Japonica Group]